MQETRIDMPTVTRAVVEGIRQYKKTESNYCITMIIHGLGITLLISILIFNVSMMKDIASIQNKVGAA
jgi:hypothetical protein